MTREKAEKIVAYKSEKSKFLAYMKTGSRSREIPNMLKQWEYMQKIILQQIFLTQTLTPSRK